MVEDDVKKKQQQQRQQKQKLFGEGEKKFPEKLGLFPCTNYRERG